MNKLVKALDRHVEVRQSTADLGFGIGVLLVDLFLMFVGVAKYISEGYTTSYGITAKTFPKDIVGIKAAHYWTSGHGPNDDAHPAYASSDNALKAGEIAGLPVMVDFGQNGRTQTYPGLLKRLRKGDFHTHVFAPQFPIINPEIEEEEE